MDEIKTIQFLHRDRNFAMDARKSLNLRLGSYLRLQLGWSKKLPEAERKRIAAEAAKLMEAEEPDRFESMIIPAREAAKIFEDREAIAEKASAKLARKFPVWAAFGKGVLGFGEGSLAVIIAECGELSEYSTEAKLWKRLGLAPRQNRVPPGLSREDRAAAWIANGYSPRRRSHMWNVGASLIKAQVRKIKDADGEDTGERETRGPYGELYLRRKTYEHARDSDMSDKHAHLRAQRYMEKRLLRDLWRAWRRTTQVLAEKPTAVLSAANSLAAE